jgi:hypothetical protein
MRKWLVAIAMVVGLMAFPALGGFAASSTTVTVLPSDVGTSWFTADTRSGGDVSFVSGPAMPPLGTGSLQMTTTDANGSSNAKAQLFNYSYIGTPLSSITELSYSDYRSSSSTNSAAQRIGLNIEVDFVGDGSSYTTLVFEPIYQADGIGALSTDTWQSWDAINGGNGIWWSTKDIPGVCAFNCFVSWNTIVTNNPNAKILGGLGFNIGSGWTGQFSGNVDALEVGVAGNTTIYDFEPALTPTGKDQCKNGGWQQFNSPTFKNQGDCIQFVNTGK